MNNTIATVHWIDVDGLERSIDFESNKAVEDFTKSLQVVGVCYWTCLCHPNATPPKLPPSSPLERIS